GAGDASRSRLSDAGFGGIYNNPEHKDKAREAGQDPIMPSNASGLTAGSICTRSVAAGPSRHSRRATGQNSCRQLLIIENNDYTAPFDRAAALSPCWACHTAAVQRYIRKECNSVGPPLIELPLPPPPAPAPHTTPHHTWLS
ncbi:hypothetical protein JZ751_028558, partial [Albula glossodonta]